jgi:hypothetical protein
MATSRSTRHSTLSTESSRARERPLRSPDKRRRHKAPSNHGATSAKHLESLAAIAQHIACMRRKLVDEAPSCEIIDEFFDGVTSEPAFPLQFQHGPSWLRDAIARSCEEILGEKTGESVVCLMTVPEHKLIHGSVMVEGYMGVAVFFEDLRLGVMGLYPSDVCDAAIYARIVCFDGACDRDPRCAPN